MSAPVLLIHSSGMSRRQWRKLVAKLEPTHTVLAPDLIGSGDNPPWPDAEPFHFRQDVDVLVAQLSALSEPAHVVGHSYGAFLALMVTLRAPQLVRSLSVYDPVLFGLLYDANDEAGLANLRSVDFVTPDDGGGPRWFEAFVDYWNGPGTWHKLPPEAQQGFLRVGRKVYGEVSTLLVERTGRAAYRALTMPALLLTGQRTPLAAQRVVAQLLEAMPNARREIIAGAGHMGPISHADSVNELIASFIAS